MLAEHDICNQPEMSIREIRVIANNGHDSPLLQDLRRCTANDEEYQHLLSFILSGFPDHHSQLPDQIRHYWHISEHRTVDDNLIVHGCRLLIPISMRKQVLSELDNSHQGAVRTKQRARLTVYWPGIDNDIENVVFSCKQCQDHLSSNHKEPILLKPTPVRPFQEVAADFCSHGGQHYLILVDCCTDWPTIIPMATNTTAPHLIAAVRQSFCCTRIPDIFLVR